MEANNLQSMANLGPMGMVSRVYALLYILNINSFRTCFKSFPILRLWKLMTLGHGLQDLCSGPLDISCGHHHFKEDFLSFPKSMLLIFRVGPVWAQWA